jgi:hypothetical protein
MDHPNQSTTDINSSSAIAAIMLAGHGADDPDQLVGVAAGELFEWAWLAAELADWLHRIADTTRLDFHHHFDRLRSPEQTAVFLAQVSERIAALLDGDRGQP